MPLYVNGQAVPADSVTTNLQSLTSLFFNGQQVLQKEEQFGVFDSHVHYVTAVRSDGTTMGKLVPSSSVEHLGAGLGRCNAVAIMYGGVSWNSGAKTRLIGKLTRDRTFSSLGYSSDTNSATDFQRFGTSAAGGTLAIFGTEVGRVLLIDESCTVVSSPSGKKCTSSMASAQEMSTNEVFIYGYTEGITPATNLTVYMADTEVATHPSLSPLEYFGFAGSALDSIRQRMICYGVSNGSVQYPGNECIVVLNYDRTYITRVVATGVNTFRLSPSGASADNIGLFTAGYGPISTYTNMNRLTRINGEGGRLSADILLSGISGASYGSSAVGF